MEIFLHAKTGTQINNAKHPVMRIYPPNKSSIFIHMGIYLLNKYALLLKAKPVLEKQQISIA